MMPVPGSRLVRWAGDTVTVELRDVPHGATGYVRTTVGQAELLRREIITVAAGTAPTVSSAWRDLPMHRRSEGCWELTLPLADTGWFEAKAFALTREGQRQWPDGPNLGISVQPAWTRSANSIYCAFIRQFGPAKSLRSTTDTHLEARVRELDEAGFHVLPRSGTLRDLGRELPHIFQTLGCRILHLLPVNPTPTTFARFGRFGSPYAAQDLTAIDPALVEFDRRTTGIQQFEELVHAVRCHGGRVMVDMVINHTGWGSTLWERRPDWFHRDAQGRFVSPGAWGNTWEDLVELDPRPEELWHELATAFLIWCRRGVDAFRCDAGYKIPLPLWRFVIARVRQEFPDAVFLLEGLGGSWEATEALLREGGMQWAYSELFQNYGGSAVQWYLDQAYEISRRAGPLMHYSETHDNVRLPSQPQALEGSDTTPGTLGPRGRQWSLFRNRLCALTSVAGGWGFTNGVEWLATERVNVHSARGLAWGSAENLVLELGVLTRLVNDHPCFFADATTRRLSPDGAAVFALHRAAANGLDGVLVLANNDLDQEQTLELKAEVWKQLGPGPWDLAASPPAPARLIVEEATTGAATIRVRLAPGTCLCLAPGPQPHGLAGEAWRRQQAFLDWQLKVRTQAGLRALPADELTSDALPAEPLLSLLRVAGLLPSDRSAATDAGVAYPKVIRWEAADARRITPVPPEHWLLVVDASPFRLRLERPGHDALPLHLDSVPAGDQYLAAVPPGRVADTYGLAELRFRRLTPNSEPITAQLLFLTPNPSPPDVAYAITDRHATVLLTNGRGAMARVAVDLGRIASKYDCLLGANLHPSVPVDRHVFVKRMRAWADVDGFVTPLNAEVLQHAEAGEKAVWEFTARGNERRTEVRLELRFLPGRNTLNVRFEHRPERRTVHSTEAPHPAALRLIVRFDLEDRNFHQETKRNDGTEHHFQRSYHRLRADDGIGFRFHPAADRQLDVRASAGHYHEAVEWSHHVPHPVEASRGLEASGDAWSPGWFEASLAVSEFVTFTLDADRVAGAAAEPQPRHRSLPALPESTNVASNSVPEGGDTLTERLQRAARHFLVSRGAGLSVIAGYPWFLDWGRDTLIAVRGLIAAGLIREVTEILLTFARFEENGTLPNAIHGEDASNRNTSDAALWFGIAVDEALAAAALDPSIGGVPLVQRHLPDGRTVRDVLRSIACGHLVGTPTGVHVDHASGLVWSPSHFTWMDTNHPAGTPREGYPVEIQALWIRHLRLLARLECEPWEGRGESWADLARRAEQSFHQYFWLEDCGWYADVLLADRHHPARTSPPSNALRSNCLLPITLGLDRHPHARSRAQRTVEAVRRWLVVPGALRSLAPLPVVPPLPVRSRQGNLLNDPNHPYWGHYEGDEDTRRKPAYHNGTAWVWTFPAFCEALLKAYPGDPAAAAAARAYLTSVEYLFDAGCVGQLPEILDGDAPHTQRGCDAQAWSVTEVLRVWRRLCSPVEPAS